MDSFLVLNESVDSLTTNSTVRAYAPVGAIAPSRTASIRSGAQSYFWTAEWQQKERLADMDLLCGNTYEPADVEDLIHHLHEVAGGEAS